MNILHSSNLSFAVRFSVVVLLAIITGDNQHSIHSFSSAGYFKCADLKEVGEKFGKLLDVVFYQKIL